MYFIPKSITFLAPNFVKKISMKSKIIFDLVTIFKAILNLKYIQIPKSNYTSKCINEIRHLQMNLVKPKFSTTMPLEGPKES